jgi:hypothetical protein
MQEIEQARVGKQAGGGAKNVPAVPGQPATLGVPGLPVGVQVCFCGCARVLGVRACQLKVGEGVGVSS